MISSIILYIVYRCQSSDGFVLCSNCKTRVRAGNGGVHNFLQRHCATVQPTKKEKKKDNLEKARGNAMKWFQPRKPPVPPTQSAPALVIPAPLPFSST